MRERGPDAEQTPCYPEPIHLLVHRQMQTLLPSLEEKRGQFPPEQGM